MNTIQAIFNMYAPSYITQYANNMPDVHKKVIRAIKECRNGIFGTVVYRCKKCGSIHKIGCSCGNRHCPNCQNEKATLWLETQMQKILPCNYFFLTLTLPQRLRNVVRSNQRIAYSAMFSCVYSSLEKLAKDKRFLGTSRIGFLAGLHTWGRMLQYHPHIHCIVPAGGLSEDRNQWLSSRQDLFVHTKPLARIFRAKFCEAMKKNGLLDKIDSSVWKQEWIVNSQSVGNAQTALRYLSRYLFRVAISNSRIISYEDNTVTFRYKDSGKGKYQTLSLDAMEFIRRFLQHVLPTGFMKIRHFGFLNANYSVSLKKVYEMICLFYEIICKLLPAKLLPKKTKLKCPKCGNTLQCILFLPVRKVPPG